MWDFNQHLTNDNISTSSVRMSVFVIQHKESLLIPTKLNLALIKLLDHQVSMEDHHNWAKSNHITELNIAS